MKNIYLFGANGMLGNYVNKYLINEKLNIIPFTRNEYDLSKLSVPNLSNFLKKNGLKRDDIIINCAGIIPQSSKDKELSKNMYYKINSIFPIVLSMIAQFNNCNFIHITTDCVFSGKEGNYNELSNPDETNDYGTSKSLGEIGYGTIIRTSIIGEEENNKRSLIEWVKSNKDKEINGFVNHWWNGVTCLQLSKIIFKIINQNLYWEGIRHIYSPSVINKFNLCRMINEIFKLNIKINEFYTEKVDKSITSIYETNDIFNIPELLVQIKELKEYKLHRPKR